MAHFVVRVNDPTTDIYYSNEYKRLKGNRKGWNQSNNDLFDIYCKDMELKFYKKTDQIKIVFEIVVVNPRSHGLE